MKLTNNQLTAILIASVVGLVVVVVKTLKKPKKEVVSGSYKASNCDELHAFENTHGKTIGGMSTKVNKALEDFYRRGLNPDITDVKIQMDSNTMEVKWTVTIEESKDGNAWVGFTSRGASGSDAYTRANSKSVAQDIESIRKKLIEKYGDSSIQIKPIFDFLYNLGSDGKANGKCPTRQIFYKFTRPSNFPKN